MDNFIGQPFLYNKSGMELIYGGEVLVKESKYQTPIPKDNQGVSIATIFYTFGLTYKPSYQNFTDQKRVSSSLCGIERRMISF